MFRTSCGIYPLETIENRFRKHRHNDVLFPNSHRYVDLVGLRKLESFVQSRKKCYNSEHLFGSNAQNEFPNRDRLLLEGRKLELRMLII